MLDKGEIEFENGITKFMGADQDLTASYIKGGKPICNAKIGHLLRKTKSINY